MQNTRRYRFTWFPVLALVASGWLLASCDAGTPEAPAPEPIEVVPIPEREPFGPAAQAAAAALEKLILDPDPYERVRRIAELLPTLGRDAVRGVEQALRNPALNPGGAEIELLTWFWATHEPESASEWAVMESPLGYRASATITAITQWASQDPVASGQAVQLWELMRANVREVVRIAHVRGFFRRDPVAAGEFVQRLEMGFSRQRALATYIRLVAQQQGPDAVMRWAESLPDDDEGTGKFKLQVFRQVGGALPAFDTDAAVRWCEAHCGGPYGADLRRFIAVRWVQFDGDAAMAWLATAEPGKERDMAVDNTYAEWTRAERERSLEWMEAQIGEDGSDMPAWLRPALSKYALLLSTHRPAEAIEWANRVEDERVRESTLIRILRHWRGMDAAAADAWLAESDLSAEVVAKIQASEPAK